MEIIRTRQHTTIPEGWYLALIVAVVKKITRKGEIPFLTCRITSGKYKGREVDFLVPTCVKQNTHLDRFLVSVLGPLGARNDVDLEVLVNRAVAIRVKRVRKGKRTYHNAVALAPPEREEETEVGG